MKKWMPWAIAGGAVVVAIVVLLIVNPPFVQKMFTGSQGGGGKEGDRVVARVGDAKLTYGDYELLVGLVAPYEDPSRINTMDRVINPWVEQEILYQAAMRSGLDKQDTVKMMLKQLDFMYDVQRKQLMVQAWLADEEKKIAVPLQEQQAYFNAHKADFLSEVKITQIIVADAGTAARVLAEIKNGRDFKALAREYSLDSLKGMSTPYVPYSAVPMADKIFSLKPGEVSEPINLGGYIAIIRLEDKRQVRKDIDFSEVSGYIEQKLLSERAQQILTTKIDSLKRAARSKVEIRMENVIAP